MPKIRVLLIEDNRLLREGITTSEVRNRVTGGIKNQEPQAAKRYESYPRRTHKTLTGTRIDSNKLSNGNGDLGSTGNVSSDG